MPPTNKPAKRASAATPTPAPIVAPAAPEPAVVRAVDVAEQIPAVPPGRGAELPPEPTEPADETAIPSLPPTNVSAAKDGRNVCVLLPQYKSTNPLTLVSVLGLRNPVSNSAVVHYGDAFIVHTRNRLAQSFLTETDAEWALFVDDDMVLPFGNAGWFANATGFGAVIPKSLQGLHTIDRLLAARKTLVGGLYFGRHAGPKRRAMFAEGSADGQYAARGFASLPVNKVVETKWVGTGCLLVHRSVFTAIQLRFPHLAPTKKGEPWQFFSAAPDGLLTAVQQYLNGTGSKENLAAAARAAQTTNLGKGEDVLFCERAAAAGHKAHVDLGLLCGHLGNTVFGVPR